MHSVARTLTAAILAVALAGGVTTGGVVAEHNLTHKPADASSMQNLATYAHVATSTPTPLTLGPNTIANIVKQDGPAVVKIVSTVPNPISITQSPFFNPFFGSIFGNAMPLQPQVQVETAIGSGFFFTANGDILTNDHVIYGAKKIEVYVPGYSKPYPATVVGSDYATDLAVIKIHPPKSMPVLTFGNSANTPVGSWDIAIGNPYNLSNTVTVGVVSAKGRPLTIGHRNYRNLLQTSAAINPGNSGGPLLNLAGQVIGINTAVETNAQGIGFAIPSSTVAQILPQLMQHGHVIRPWLGVFVSTDSSQISQAYQLGTDKGVVVIRVQPNSPASAAGMEPGDVITAVNHQPLTSVSQLQDLVERHRVGDTLQMTINRQGQTIILSVTLAQEPNGPITPLR